MQLLKLELATVIIATVSLFKGGMEVDNFRT